MTDEARRELIEMAVLERVAPIIRNAAHPLRLRILDYLDTEGEPRTVGQIAEVCGVAPTFVSQQLRILKDQGVLGCRRSGNYVLYEIANPALLHLISCIRQHQGECA